MDTSPDTLGSAYDPFEVHQQAESARPAVPRAGTFSLRTLMLVMTFLSVLMAVWAISKPAGVLATLVLLPTFVRALYVAYLWRRAGEEIGVVDLLGLCISSLGIIVVTYCSCLYLAGLLLAIQFSLLGAINLMPSVAAAILMVIPAFVVAVAWPCYYLLRPSLWDGPSSPLTSRPIRPEPMRRLGEREP